MSTERKPTTTRRRDTTEAVAFFSSFFLFFVCLFVCLCVWVCFCSREDVTRRRWLEHVCLLAWLVARVAYFLGTRKHERGTKRAKRRGTRCRRWIGRRRKEKKQQCTRQTRRLDRCLLARAVSFCRSGSVDSTGATLAGALDGSARSTQNSVTCATTWPHSVRTQWNSR